MNKMCSNQLDEVKDCELNMANMQIHEETEALKPYIQNKALRMMEKMGYKTGAGLGKCEQGITNIIDVTYQLGKKGLGSKLKNMESTTLTWDFTKEEVTIRENYKWLQSHSDFHFTFEEMLLWMKEGRPNYNIENECNFCDKEILVKVLRAKDIFDELDIMELVQARARSNPFETIKSVFFMNRAALKMANIDAATDYMFSNIDQNEHHIDHKGPFYFADVCAGPGGFSEYILWRKQWNFKGFGLTLKGENDFRLNESTCTSHVSFQPLYGKYEDGNVCSPENIIDFKEKVLLETDCQGVHFMMSDGGFSVEGNENLQEILSKNIYICQCLVALEIIRTHGHFVTKLFDVFTSFSVGLLYLMYQCFDKVTILKPNSSRPANSERYLICAGLKNASSVQVIKKYLSTVVQRLWDVKNIPDVDILEIVPLDILKLDRPFYSYIYETNQQLGIKQTVGLEKLSVFCHNPTLVEARQEEFRKECLKFWQVPDKPKCPFRASSVNDLLNLAMDSPEILHLQPREICKIDDFNLTVAEVDDWHFSPLYCTRNRHNINFYAAVGSSRVYRFQKNKWLKAKNIQLWKGTLLYGEFVKENVIQKIDGKDVESYRYSLHVIDALRLGEKSLTNLSFNERLKLIEIYCKSVNKELQPNLVRIRPKSFDRLRNISAMPLHIKNNDGSKYITLPHLGYNCVSEELNVNSLLLLKTDKSQSFYSTYIIRVQIFINDQTDDEYLSLKEIISEIKQKV